MNEWTRHLSLLKMYCVYFVMKWSRIKDWRNIEVDEKNCKATQVQQGLVHMFVSIVKSLWFDICTHMTFTTYIRK